MAPARAPRPLAGPCAGPSSRRRRCMRVKGGSARPAASFGAARRLRPRFAAAPVARARPFRHPAPSRRPNPCTHSPRSKEARGRARVAGARRPAPDETCLFSSVQPSSAPHRAREPRAPPCAVTANASASLRVWRQCNKIMQLPHTAGYTQQHRLLYVSRYERRFRLFQKGSSLLSKRGPCNRSVRGDGPAPPRANRQRRRRTHGPAAARRPRSAPRCVHAGPGRREG
jgi:hypothetical protein